MTSREDAVSEVIGGVLLIALVMIGAALVGTYILSQPLPEKVPKVQFGTKEYNGIIYLEHEGGESLNEGDIGIVIDGSPIPDSSWTDRSGGFDDRHLEHGRPDQDRGQRGGRIGRSRL